MHGPIQTSIACNTSRELNTAPMVSTLHLHFQIKPPRLRQQVAMPGQEPELDGFARMIGGGAWIPNGLGDRSQGLVLNSVECM